MDNAQGGYRYPSIQMRKSPSNKTWWVLGLLALLTAGTFLFKSNQGSFQPQQTPIPSPSLISAPQTASSSATPLTLGKRTKTGNCISTNGLPDKECTPGDIDPKVNQDNIQQTICVYGYTKTVRPPVSYTNALKIKQIQAYNFSDTNTKDYEEDHLISLELGGNPTSEANLWPEPYNITNNAREKDKVENYLHDQICSGKISLQEAQYKIANNWEEFYKSAP